MQSRSLWLKNRPTDVTDLLRFQTLPFLSSRKLQRLPFELLRWSCYNLGFNAPCKISSHKISSNCYNLKRRYSFICAYHSLHPNKLWGLTQRVVPLNPNSAKRAVGLMLTVFLMEMGFCAGVSIIMWYPPSLPTRYVNQSQSCREKGDLWRNLLFYEYQTTQG